MNIFRTDQLRILDAKTIALEGILSSTLMDRAANALFQKIRDRIHSSDKVLVMAGPGNNGGDALVVARLLIQSGYQVTTVLCNYGKTLTKDATLQFERLKSIPQVSLLIPDTPEELSSCTGYDYVIDGLFGSGLNKPLDGVFAVTIQWMNRQPAIILSIDIPSGLSGEDNSYNHLDAIVRANYTLGLQFPRLAFLLPENETYIGDWELVDIGIHEQAIRSIVTPFSLTTREEARLLLKNRPHFSHKGDFGKCLIIAGSKGMTGAAVLAGRGALRSGVGLLTYRVPSESLTIVQTAVPEAIAQTWEKTFWDDTCSAQSWTAIGVGPGLGKSADRPESLERLLKQQPQRLVLDADALNILAKKPNLLDRLPKLCILTPHPGEFDRLARMSFNSGYDRLIAAIRFAMTYHIYLVLKGAYTVCITPEGTCRFNQSGNSGMSTGGSGDVLTGIIVSLLAQGYTQQDACILGTFIHGHSADLALEHQSQESLTAGDIAEHLGVAFNALRKP